MEEGNNCNNLNVLPKKWYQCDWKDYKHQKSTISREVEVNAFFNLNKYKIIEGRTTFSRLEQKVFEKERKLLEEIRDDLIPKRIASDLGKPVKTIELTLKRISFIMEYRSTLGLHEIPTKLRK